jgi:hypothetical protein
MSHIVASWHLRLITPFAQFIEVAQFIGLCSSVKT